MTTKHCSTCRFWDASFSAHKAALGKHFVAREGKEGVCLRATREGNDSGSLAVPVMFRSWAETYADRTNQVIIRDLNLLTAPDFGCVMHGDKA